MTFATIAALIIRDVILKRENPWQELFSVDRKKIRGGTWDYIKKSLDYPYYMLADRLKLPKAVSADEIAKGQGQIIKLDGRNIACSRDQRGRLHQVADEGRTAEEVSQFGEKTPMGRPAQPEEIAPAFVFLASDADSSYITGHVLPILGGEVASG